MSAVGTVQHPLPLHTTPAYAASDASSDVSGINALAAEEVPASSSAAIGSWRSQIDLHNSECVYCSEGLRDGSIVYTPQLFSSSGDTAGSETIAPSGSDDVLDHEACGPARSVLMMLMVPIQVVEVNVKVQRGFWFMAPVTPRKLVATVLI